MRAFGVIAILLAGAALADPPFPCDAKALHGKEMAPLPVARDERWDLFTGRLGDRLVTLRLSGKRITGAVYDPATDRWKRIPDGPQLDPDAVIPPSPIGRYLVSTDVHGRRWLLDAERGEWSAMPPAISFDPNKTGAAAIGDRSFLIWPKGENAETFSRASRIELDRGERIPLPTDGAPGPRLSEAMARCGDQFLVWGGERTVLTNGAPTGSRPLRDGAVLDLRSNRWKPVSTTGAPSPRGLAAALCLGSRFLVFGTLGAKGGDESSFARGALYDPAEDRWTALPTHGAPEIIWQHWNGQADEDSQHGGLSVTTAKLIVAGEHLVYFDPMATPSGASGAVLDLRENSWHRLPAPPTSDATVSFASEPGMGGSTEPEVLLFTSALALDANRVLFLANLDSTWKAYGAVLDVAKRSWCRVQLPHVGPLQSHARMAPAFSGTPDSPNRSAGLRPGGYLATLLEPNRLVIWGASAATVPPPCSMGARCLGFQQQEFETTAGAVITW